MLAPRGPPCFTRPRGLEPRLISAKCHFLENLPAVSDAELILEKASAPSKLGTCATKPIHRANQAHGSTSNPANPPRMAPHFHLAVRRQVPRGPLEERTPRDRACGKREYWYRCVSLRSP